MIVKIFVRDNCPKCPKAKDVGKALEGKNTADVRYFNVSDADGLAESVFYDVLSTPSIVVVDKNDKEVVGFRADVPALEELEKYL